MDLLFLHRLESLLVVRLIRTNAKHLERMTHIMWNQVINRKLYSVPDQVALFRGRRLKRGATIVVAGGVFSSAAL